jgi:hypothetical protein
MSKRTTENAREVQNEDMKNENDSELGKLLVECSKGFHFWLVVIPHALSFFAFSYMTFRVIGVILDPKSWAIKISNVPFVLIGFFAPIFSF